jgi:hypothetical protein
MEITPLEEIGTKPIRVLVCGSRHFNDVPFIEGVLDAFSISCIIEGEARGVDKIAGAYGKRRGLDVCAFPARWDLHGKAAGPIRNTQMLKEGLPDLVIAFRGPNSRGTQNMIDQAEKAGIPTKIIDIGV